MTTFTTPRAGLLLTTAFAATLACGQAGAATYEGRAGMGKLRFVVTDLTPDDGVAAGYSFNPQAETPFVGSISFAEVYQSNNPGAFDPGTFTRSDPLTEDSPFDTMPGSRTVSAHGHSATVEINGNLLSSSVQTGSALGYTSYAEGVIGAVNLNSQNNPAIVQNSMLLSAHSMVTIQASAWVGAYLADATACPGCEAEFTGFAALVGSDQFGAYFAAGGDNRTSIQSALHAAGISFVGMEQLRTQETTPNVDANDFLELTFRNDTSEAKPFSFFADGWITGTTVAASAVPEPSAIAMALAGLLVTGVLAWRRRQA